jgi:hypothetical protein
MLIMDSADFFLVAAKRFMMDPLYNKHFQSFTSNYSCGLTEVLVFKKTFRDWYHAMVADVVHKWRRSGAESVSEISNTNDWNAAHGKRKREALDGGW